MKTKIDPEVPPHRKRISKARKLFAIESRHHEPKGGSPGPWMDFLYKWSSHSKYHTREQRDQALADLRKGQRQWMEFRPIDLKSM